MSATPNEREQPLPGGLGSGGAVVRIGDTVRRPERFFSASVRAFLNHLAVVGFDGAPRPVGSGLDDHGREVLTFLHGSVGVPPFPRWVADEALLVSVAELQRRLHRAARTFVAPRDARWDRANLPPASTDAIVCHNDLCIENVVVQDGRAVGVIDFDFAAPNDPLIDIAIAARHWLPVRDRVDLDPELLDVDQVGRFARFCDVHELDAAQRQRVVELIGDFLDRALATMKARHDQGMPGYVQIWQHGYPAQNRRSRDWLDANALALAASAGRAARNP